MKRISVVFLILCACFVPGASGQGKFKTLYAFKGGTDGIPQAGVTFDQTGNLYGTTTWGGAAGCGSVYELTPNQDGRWTKSVLHSFTCSDGDFPTANLILDKAGNLYGTTIIGGTHSAGTIFELSKNADGTFTESTLYNFTGGQYGCEPFFDALVLDGAGNLYSTTYFCGAGNSGVAFELTPNSDGSWTECVLHTFTGADGAQSRAGLILDAAGNLYGMTQMGGADGQGTVFELAHNPDGSWTERVLHSFTGGRDGGQPYSGLVFDPAGNLYGMTYQGGAHGWGTVFKLAPNSDGRWTGKLLHQFTGGRDGGNPQGSLIFDAAGNLYGTTCGGGAGGYGVAFKLAPNPNGKWNEIAYQFTDTPGDCPISGLIFDAAGNLYGTTAGDQIKTFGSVFEITP